MNLRSKLIRLAHQQPKLRVHLLPLLSHAKLASTCSIVKGAEREGYLDQVWAMYTLTYKQIGMGVKNPREILSEFPQWELCLNSEGKAVAFNLFKSTPFGTKSGLSGSDGSSEGKGLVLNAIRAKFKKPGVYGEISHKVLEIALAAGAPVVCAAYASKVLGKAVDPEPNGVAYKRNLSGVGTVTKVLVGNPKGIPTTDWSNPQCPIGVMASGSEVTADDLADFGAHFACALL